MKSRRSLLAIHRHLPCPDRDGGSLRFWNILKAYLDIGFDLSFIATEPRPGLSETECEIYRRNLIELGIELPRLDVVEHLKNDGGRYDAILVSEGAYLASELLATVRSLAPKSKFLFDTVQLHHLFQFREAKLSGSAQQLHRALQLKKLEIAIAKLSDATFFVSEVEREILSAECPGLRSCVVPNVHETHPPVTQFSERSGLLFVGAMQYPPNIDAMIYFCHEILPLLWKDRPELSVDIVGSSPGPEILALANDKVKIRGYIADLGEFYRRARISVAPLRFGAGIKGKVLESLGWGLPVVTTSVGAEGLGSEDWLSIADDAPSFAKAVVALYENPQMWLKLSQQGQRKIESDYSFQGLRRRLEEFMNGQASTTA